MEGLRIFTWIFLKNEKEFYYTKLLLKNIKLDGYF